MDSALDAVMPFVADERRVSLASDNGHAAPRRVLTLFGTRPEIIKLAPVIRALESGTNSFRTINVASGQHTDLIEPFIRLFGVRVDHNLNVMEPGQTPNRICARVLAALDPLLMREQPDAVLVQGDTTTALAGALAGFHHRIPVGHVEAGLRSQDRLSPYPEEMNRRLITQLASLHFAATSQNRDTLLSEKVPAANIVLTGNPVVDALHWMLERRATSPLLAKVLQATRGLKRIVLTTHRRESFGPVMASNLEVLGEFTRQHSDVALIFPVHPNPAVRQPAHAALAGRPRVFLLDPLEYADFIGLLAESWLIVSDSGGVQEEAPTLGKPLLVLRENTERPEAVEAGVARLVGGSPDRLRALLEEVYADEAWRRAVARIENPYGEGDSGPRIARALAEALAASARAD